MRLTCGFAGTSLPHAHPHWSSGGAAADYDEARLLAADVFQAYYADCSPLIAPSSPSPLATAHIALDTSTPGAFIDICCRLCEHRENNDNKSANNPPRLSALYRTPACEIVRAGLVATSAKVERFVRVGPVVVRDTRAGEPKSG